MSYVKSYNLQLKILPFVPKLSAKTLCKMNNVQKTMENIILRLEMFIRYAKKNLGLILKVAIGET